MPILITDGDEIGFKPKPEISLDQETISRRVQ